MEQSVIRSNSWNEASKYGLILGLISVAYLYLGHLQINLEQTGLFSIAIGFVAWAAKFAGCILLMKHAMMKFVHCNPESTNTDTFKLGAKIALLSALVFAVITVADQLYIFPEYYQTIYSAALEEYAKILPAEQVKEIKDMLVQAPKISFFGTFLYCAAYGTVLSFILSRNIPSRNPFNNDKPQEQ